MMKYYSTRNRARHYTFRDAVVRGLADDGGLYMPEFIPKLDASFQDSAKHKSLAEIGLEVLKDYIGDEIPEAKFGDIVKDAFNFPAPVKHLYDNYYILELFHGPTFAFKDFGARFMARVLGYFVKDYEKELHILVATSGDTGSAVANGFYNVEGIRVHLLYPSGRVSELQEKQLTTYGGNVTAIEVDGSFDDCQKLVKQAFNDTEVREKLNISSANSINIARLLPQSLYYFSAINQIGNSAGVRFSVPSGNLGNLTAGIMAKKMGLPVKGFISATNKNDVFTKYINNGEFKPGLSERTISNAMDVGNPSNFERLMKMYDESHAEMIKDITSFTFSDNSTMEAIGEVYEKSGYIIDPHGAVGYLAAKEAKSGVILGTAHPAKFGGTIEGILNMKIELPEGLNAITSKKKKVVPLAANYSTFRDYLLSHK
ncbi:MAG: threonine synthase [Melioribacteraceae bacterium]|nr:MAG: threonine synthase [Melioribacteraceae bacterium]